MQRENEIFELLKKVSKYLEEEEITFALAGGLAANLYRSAIRATGDLDFVIYSEGNIIDDGNKALKSLGYEPYEVREAELAGGPLHKIKSKSSPVCILTGRSKDPLKIRVDFLLHTLKWPLSALKRAQNNKVRLTKDLEIPCLLAEDIIVAKLQALDHKATRFKDMDDIQSILSEDPKIDWPYILSQIAVLQLRGIPRDILNLIPPPYSKEMKRLLKKK